MVPITSDETLKPLGSGRRIVLNGSINISGTVNLILRDRCSLYAEEGINVPAGSTLNIYGQRLDTGTIMATSDDNVNAPIGSNVFQNCGTITIHGGNISASGSLYSAGIGGGWAGTGGAVTINGGTVLLATGFTIMKVKEIPVANMIPAMVFAMPVSWFWANVLLPLL